MQTHSSLKVIPLILQKNYRGQIFFHSAPVYGCCIGNSHVKKGRLELILCTVCLLRLSGVSWRCRLCQGLWHVAGGVQETAGVEATWAEEKGKSLLRIVFDDGNEEIGLCRTPFFVWTRYIRGVSTARNVLLCLLRQAALYFLLEQLKCWPNPVRFAVHIANIYDNNAVDMACNILLWLLYLSSTLFFLVQCKCWPNPMGLAVYIANIYDNNAVDFKVSCRSNIPRKRKLVSTANYLNMSKYVLLWCTIINFWMHVRSVHRVHLRPWSTAPCLANISACSWYEFFW